MPRRSGGGGGGGGADWYSAGRGRGRGAAGRGGKRGKKGDADKKHRRKAKAGAEEAAARPSVRQQPERNPLPPATTSSEDEEANNNDGGGETRHPQQNIVPDATAAATAAPANATELKPVPTKIEDLSATDTVADALNKLSEAAYDCAAGISVGLGPEIVKRIKKKHAQELAVLADVLFSLRNRVSLEGTARTTSTFDQPGFENKASWFHGSNSDNCFVLDRFLWSAEDEDRLESVGALRRSYCANCGKLFPFQDGVLLDQCAVDGCGGAMVGRHWITNSLPLDQSMLIFTTILPGQGVDLRGKKVVDVGSRLGNNLVVGSLFTDAAELVGVEIDEWFAAESQGMLDRCVGLRSAYSEAGALEADDAGESGGGGDASDSGGGGGGGVSVGNASVVCADIVDCPDLLRSADVVIFFNPFEQLHEAAAGKRLLMLFAKRVSRPGTVVVTIPSAEDIYARAGCVLDLVAGKTTGCVDIGTWLRPRGNHDDIYVYEVIGNGVH